MKGYILLGAAILIIAILLSAGCMRNAPAASPAQKVQAAPVTAAPVAISGTPAAPPAQPTAAANVTAGTPAGTAPATISPADLARINSDLQNLQATPETPPG